MSNRKILLLLAGIIGFSLADSGPAAAQNIADGKEGMSAQKVSEQEIINLSKDKWQWMSDKNVDVLALVNYGLRS
jgi:hypothetical protein